MTQVPLGYRFCMHPVFSSNKVFVQDMEPFPREAKAGQFTSLAGGIQCVRYEKGDEKWGQVSWYDMIAGYQRTYALDQAPHITGEHLEFNAEGMRYLFDPVASSTIDRIAKLVPHLLPHLRACKDEAELQAFLKAKALE